MIPRELRGAHAVSIAAALVLSLPLLTAQIHIAGITAVLLLSAFVYLFGKLKVPALSPIATHWFAAVLFAWGLSAWPAPLHTPAYIVGAAIVVAIFREVVPTVPRLLLWPLGVLAALATFDPRLPLAPWSLLLPQTPSFNVVATLAAIALLARTVLTSSTTQRSAERSWPAYTLALAWLAIIMGRGAEASDVTSFAIASDLLPLHAFGIFAPLLLAPSAAPFKQPKRVMDFGLLVAIAVLGGPALWAYSMTTLPLLWVVVHQYRQRITLYNIVFICVLVLLTWFSLPPLPSQLSEGLRLGVCGALLVVSFAWPSIFAKGRHG